MPYLANIYEVMVPPKTPRDYRKWASVRVDALNHALEGLPQERMRYHVCWGSWNGPHAHDVAIEGHRRLHPEGAGRRPIRGNGQSAPRA